MPPKSRREQYAEATRNAILDAALDFFIERGYIRTSLDDIAERAQVSKGAIYHHFDSKVDMFEVVFARVIRTYADRLKRQMLNYPDSWATVTDLLNAYFDICIDPVFCRMVLQEGPIALGWEHWRHVERELFLESFLELVQRYTQEATLAGVSADLLLKVLASAIQEMALNVIDSSDREHAVTEARMLISELVASIRRSAGERS